MRIDANVAVLPHGDEYDREIKLRHLLKAQERGFKRLPAVPPGVQPGSADPPSLEDEGNLQLMSCSCLGKFN